MIAGRTLYLPIKKGCCKFAPFRHPSRELLLFNTIQLMSLADFTIGTLGMKKKITLVLLQAGRSLQVMPSSLFVLYY